MTLAYRTIAPPVKLPDDVFGLLQELVYQHSGIVFDAQSKFLFETRLQQRLKVCQCQTFRDYYLFLRYDQRRNEELAECIDLVAIHETYFFRENEQLKCFMTELLPEFIQEHRQRRALRIWSAGCSTGEEPYTLSILLSEHPELQGWEIEILATDISPRVLQYARKGVYRESSFRVTEPGYLNRYFEPTTGGWRLQDTPRQMVSFLCLNLLDAQRQGLIWGMDFIFCRNVLIYFDATAKQLAAEIFYDKLRAGGYLLLGHAESLLNMSTQFRMRHLSHDLVYQKPPSAGQEHSTPPRGGPEKAKS